MANVLILLLELYLPFFLHFFWWHFFGHFFFAFYSTFLGTFNSKYTFLKLKKNNKYDPPIVSGVQKSLELYWSQLTNIGGDIIPWLVS